MRGCDFRRLTTLAEIDANAGAWRDLEERCGDRLTYFQSFDWCRNWVAAFSGTGAASAFRIKTVWQDGRLIAVWPLMVQTVGGVRVLQSLGMPHSQYSNLVCEAPHLVDALAAELIGRINRDPQCDVAVFQPVPQPSALARLLQALPVSPTCQESSTQLDLTRYLDPEAYRSEGGKLKRRNRNRRRNHLARLGELSFEVIWPDDPRFAALVREGAAMKRVWLKEKGRGSVGFSVDGFDDFLASLPGSAQALSGACLSVLRAGERLVACELGFLRQGHYYAYMGSFDWELAHLSPGKVQMEYTVCWLIEQGATAYDLLGGAGDYKQSWSNATTELCGYSLPFSWKGRIYADAWLSVLRPVLKDVYNRVPDGVRRLMSGMQSFGLVLLSV